MDFLAMYRRKENTESDRSKTVVGLSHVKLLSWNFHSVLTGRMRVAQKKFTFSTPHSKPTGNGCSSLCG
jgi:hypothetical protein